MLLLRTLAGEESQAYRDERMKATERAASMSDAELQAELAKSSLSVLTHNVFHAALAARQPRLPDEPQSHVHVTDYDPWERR